MRHGLSVEQFKLPSILRRASWISGQRSMHLRVRSLQIIIEFLLLVVVQDLSHPVTGLVSDGSDSGQALLLREACILHEFEGRVVQVLQDWFDFVALRHGRKPWPFKPELDQSPKK